MKFRPLLSWVIALMDQPQIANRLQWDARKIYKYDEETCQYTRIYGEPFTADNFWKIQVREQKILQIICLMFFSVKFTSRCQTILHVALSRE